MLVPVLYKISTVVDSVDEDLTAERSRSLQNFYCCRYARCAEDARRSRSLQNFYCCRSEAAHPAYPVPVLYKISTVVDHFLFPCVFRVPVLYKISTVVDMSFSSFAV